MLELEGSEFQTLGTAVLTKSIPVMIAVSTMATFLASKQCSNLPKREMFCSFWLSAGMATANTESCEKSVAPDHNPGTLNFGYLHRHQNKQRDRQKHEWGPQLFRKKCEWVVVNYGVESHMYATCCSQLEQKLLSWV